MNLAEELERFAAAAGRLPTWAERAEIIRRVTVSHSDAVARFGDPLDLGERARSDEWDRALEGLTKGG